MKSMKRALCASVVAAIATMAALSSAQAAPVIRIAPATQNVALAGTVGVDIFVDNLAGAIGAYSFDVNYDITRLTTSAANIFTDPDNKMGDVLNPASIFSLGDNGFRVNLAMLAGFFLPADEATLFTLQGGPGGSFKLGHIDFTAVGNGLTNLNLANFSLSLYDGLTAYAGVTAQNGQVCVGDPAGCTVTVPEPTTMLLVASALGGLAIRRKQPRPA